MKTKTAEIIFKAVVGKGSQTHFADVQKKGCMFLPDT